MDGTVLINITLLIRRHVIGSMLTTKAKVWEVDYLHACRAEKTVVMNFQTIKSETMPLYKTTIMDGRFIVNICKFLELNLVQNKLWFLVLFLLTLTIMSVTFLSYSGSELTVVPSETIHAQPFSIIPRSFASSRSLTVYSAIVFRRMTRTPV